MARALADFPLHWLPMIFQAMIVYYPILAILGITANLLAIVVLSRGKLGLSKCATRYLVSMAVGDLLVAINNVLFNKIRPLYFPGGFLSMTPVCSLRMVLLSAAGHISVWFTVAFTFDRMVAICWPKLKAIYCTERTAAVVIGVISGLSCMISIPWYFLFEPWEMRNKVPYYCKFKSIYYTSVVMVFQWFDYLTTPLVPFFLILLLNAVTVRHILLANRIRRNLLNQNRESVNDVEMVNRRKSIALLFTISGSFILLWLMYVFEFTLSRNLDNFFYNGPSHPVYIFIQMSDMLMLLSSCTNTIIYAVTQSKFREEMKILVTYPFRHIFKRVK